MLALFLVMVVATQAPATPARFDKVIALEIDATDAVLDGHGRSERFEFVPEFSGTLHLWTSAAPAIDPFLRVEHPDGVLIAEDERSGGGKTPYAVVEVEAGRSLVVIAAANEEATGKIEVHLVAAPESEATIRASERAKTNLDEVKRLREAKDLATARERVVEVLAELLATEGAESSGRIAARAWEAGLEADGLSLLAPSARAWELVLTHRSRTLPAEHDALQRVRQGLGASYYKLGNTRGAHALFEAVLAARLATLSEEHSDVQSARTNVALTARALGDLHAARDLEEMVLEIRMRTQPDEHPFVQRARANLAKTLAQLGDLERARSLEEKVLDVLTRTMPSEHTDLLWAKMGLGATLAKLGELRRAQALFEEVLEVRSRILPAGHPELLTSREALATTSMSLGDLERARSLFEHVLEGRLATLPDDHERVQYARSNLSVVLQQLGDLQGARALGERVLDVQSRALPDDHPSLQLARQNLAVTLRALRDYEGARELFAKVLDVYTRTVPDDHPDLQKARQNLAATISELGDFEGARELDEKALAVREATLAEEHPDLQTSRSNLARTLVNLGEFARGRALQERVLEVRRRTLPENHPELQMARQNLAVALAKEVARSRGSPSTPGAAEVDRGANQERCAELMRDYCRAELRSVREALFSSSSREAEERCARSSERLDISLSFGAGVGVFDPIAEIDLESFVLSESARAAAVASAAVMRLAADEPEYAALRASLREASDELAALSRGGTTSDEFQRALRKREEIERALVTLARELTQGESGAVDFDVDALAKHIGSRDAVVGLRRYDRAHLELGELRDASGEPEIRTRATYSMCAFVLRSSTPGSSAHELAPGSSATPRARLIRVELGPVSRIEEAVQRWRDALGVSAGASRGVSAAASTASDTELTARGMELRRLLFDPLLPALAGVDHVIIALDDVAHLVPLDALPADDLIEIPTANGGARAPSESRRLGDRWRIETRVTLGELARGHGELAAGGEMLAVGGVAYDDFASPVATATDAHADATAGLDSLASARTGAPRTEQSAGALRGTTWAAGFSDLPATLTEVRGVARIFRERFGESGSVTLLEHQAATRQEMLSVAPRAAWLHVATHGWFARESIPSWNDPRPLDAKSGLGTRRGGEAEVQGMSPMLLCGLAFAGANRPADELGGVPGLVTAEELSTVDLRRCKLVVLSACDTNVGERRAGQGVASLQKALQMAGARSVITSLWKVPDDATKELMLDFYRRMWVEKKPRSVALWEAKKHLRDARDDRGELKYTTRDWAAWVLTGDPR